MTEEQVLAEFMAVHDRVVDAAKSIGISRGALVVVLADRAVREHIEEVGVGDQSRETWDHVADMLYDDAKAEHLKPKPIPIEPPLG